MKYGLFLAFLDKGVPPPGCLENFSGPTIRMGGGGRGIQLGKGRVLLWNWASLNWWGFCLFLVDFALISPSPSQAGTRININLKYIYLYVKATECSDATH